VPHNGGTATYTLTITRTGSFSSLLNMSVTGLPAGASGSFSPNPANTSSTLTVTVPSSVSKGTYPFTVTASGGSPTITHTANGTLQSR
jgi:serine protease AprX